MPKITRARWRALVILAVIDIAVGLSVTVIVSPDGAGKATDGRTDHGAFDRRKAADHSTANGAEGAANGGTGHDPAKRRIIARWSPGIISAVLDVAVRIAVVLAIGPAGPVWVRCRNSAVMVMDRRQTRRHGFR